MKIKINKKLQKEVLEYCDNDQAYCNLLMSSFKNRGDFLKFKENISEMERNDLIFKRIRVNFKTEDDFEEFKNRVVSKKTSNKDLLRQYIDNEADIESAFLILKKYKNRTSGVKKLKNYAMEIMRSEGFQKRIDLIREKYHIVIMQYLIPSEYADTQSYYIAIRTNELNIERVKNEWSEDKISEFESEMMNSLEWVFAS